MQQKHTPGKWHHYHAKLREQFSTVIDEIQDDNGKAIVFWSGFDSVERPKYETRANCKLIARAPDLLAENAKLTERVRELTEALSMLVDRNITYREEEIIIRFESHFHATNAAVKARAALSRAKEEA